MSSGALAVTKTVPKWLILGITVVLISVVLCAGLSMHSIKRLYDAQERVLQSDRILLGLERLLSIAKDAETGQRGFLLTGDPQYLAPYQTALAAFDQQVNQLQSLIQDNPAELARLAQLKEVLDNKFKELEITINLQRQQEGEAAVLVMRSNFGRDLMEAARAKVAEINTIETDLLRAREQARTETRQLAIFAVLATGLFALLTCSAFIYMLRKHLSSQALANARIFHEKELCRVTLASIGDAVIATDLSGQVTSINSEAQKLTGWSQQDAMDQPLENIFNIVNADTREHVENPIRRASAQGTVVGMASHTVLIAKDGTETYIEDSAAPIKDQAGDVIGGVLVFRNINARTQLEKTRQENDRRKDAFLATLAHELRNPLAPLRNALHLARNMDAIDDRTPVQTAELLEMMERQVQQVVRLVDDLFDVGRMTQGKLAMTRQPVDIKYVVRHTLETCAVSLKAGNHDLQIALSEEPLFVEGDVGRLSQAVCNVLTNAIKFSHPNSIIRMTVVRDDKDVVLTVQDNGVGIPTDKLEQIFEMFSQLDTSERPKAGLGIGLNLARQIVKMHDGTIYAVSDGPGHGSEFVVRLPALLSVPAAPAEAATRMPNDRNNLKKLKILVADDNKDAADSMGMLLGVYGHEVHVVYDGSDAVEAAQRLQPHAIFLDIGMPKMNGYEAARTIRQQAGAARVILIALTGWGQEEDRRRSKEAGFDHHLTKPVEVDELERALSTARNPGN